MNIIITGNTSALSNVLKKYLESAHHIFLTGRNSEADIYLDFGNYEETPNNLPECADVIIHCAASMNGNGIKDAIQNEVVNSIGAFKVAEIAELVNCKHVIYISSISVYEKDNDYFGSYGLSKRHGQENLKFICSKNGISFTALMLSQVYDDTFVFEKHQPLFYNIIENASKGRDITLFGSNDALRNLIHAQDIAEVIKRIIDSRLTGEFDCVSPRSYKLSEIVRIAIDTFNKGGEIRFHQDKPNIGNMNIPHDQSLYESLSFVPQIDLEEGMKRIRNLKRREEI